MASAAVGNELECFLCRCIYRDPVNLECGDKFCQECIETLLDSQEKSATYSCPECNKKFRSRPALYKNTALRSKLQNFLSDEPEVKSEFTCTQCFHASVPAVKYCLLCEAFLCDNHLNIHCKSLEHIITDPSTSPEERKCSVHNKLLQYYCIEDSVCVCVSCFANGEHTGHHIESLKEASVKKRVQLSHILQNLITHREEIEKTAESLQKSLIKVQEKATNETKRVSTLLNYIRIQINELEKKVHGEIYSHAERLSFSNQMQNLESKKNELSRKIQQIEELCNVTDELSVLQESDIGNLYYGDGTDNNGSNYMHLHSDRDLDIAGILQALHSDLSDIFTGIQVYFQVYESADIVLNLNTAGNFLTVSNDGKMASWSFYQKYTSTPERFHYPQVLSMKSFCSGRHYWELDAGESRSWIAGMCYHSIDRKTFPYSTIGKNNKSWGLYKVGNQYSVLHDSKDIQIASNISTNRFRIYLDYRAGQLSFYALCDPMKHLYTFKATFTEPLHAALWLGENSCIRISAVAGSFGKSE
ncbi:E3 ubiquitin/ISG15 ligase TRIM25-like [Pyxicephalus adspersus]|uniref:E3 ubiquitin/ISG15 ligase TRIM25-like n=1 Tax=Pyxicephalus adspersus TaxID=30357 RepID=UPI003B5BC0A5